VENQGDASDSDGTIDDVEKNPEVKTASDWTTDAHNPYNWPARRKWAQVGMVSSIAFLA
jgi:hypothetical protein